jgi:CBS domain containing-hemolysin-like protein
MNVAISIVLKILAVLLLVLTNAFFVAAEFAFVRIRETQLEAQVLRNRRSPKLARHIVQNLNAYLSATQLGVTMASLGLGYLGEPVFYSLLQPLLAMIGVASDPWQRSISFAVGFGVLTFLNIVVGELAPKWLTIQKPLPIALWSAWPLHAFYLAFYPFNRLLNIAARLLLRQIGIEPDAAAGQAHSEEELRLVLGAAHGAATRGRTIALSALDLRNRAVREIMRPRQEIAVLDADATFGDCLSLIERTRYSRFPICDNSDPDKMRGVIHIKDIYPQRNRAKTAADLVPYARKPIYVPETAQLEKTLQLFLERKSHFAVVVDEYGGTLGIVTLENVLETLVGQIQDEFDQEKSELVRINEDVWEIAGALALPDLEKIIGAVEHGEGVATASGWITEKLGGFPKTGDTLIFGTFKLQVEEMDGTRIGRLKIIKRGDSQTDMWVKSRETTS